MVNKIEVDTGSVWQSGQHGEFCVTSKYYQCNFLLMFKSGLPKQSREKIFSCLRVSKRKLSIKATHPCQKHPNKYELLRSNIIYTLICPIFMALINSRTLNVEKHCHLFLEYYNYDKWKGRGEGGFPPQQAANILIQIGVLTHNAWSKVV